MREGWQTKRLGDFASAVSTGPFGSILHKSDYVDDGVPLVNPTNIVGESIVPDPLKLIGEVTIKQLDNYVLEEGDIVVARRGEIGRCAVVGPSESGWICGTGSFFIRPLPSLDSQFLAHLIRSPEYREQLERLSTGATMKNLSNTALGDLVVSVPPLAEQQRIVALLDEAFAGLAIVKANTEQNLQNARALFESHLQSVFGQRGEGWVETRLHEIGKTQTGSTPKTTDKRNYGDFIPFVKPGDFMADGTLEYGKDGLSKAGADGARIVPAGSVLMVCIGATIGKCGYSDQAVTTNQQVNALTPSDGSSNRFIYYQMLTESFQRSVINASGQATLPIINKLNWSSLPVWLPPTVAEQEAIAEEFDALLDETQRLTRIYERKLAALEELKKSLLHQAFNGEL
jgi:type I restriction enzyme S subunit